MNDTKKSTEYISIKERSIMFNVEMKAQRNKVNLNSNNIIFMYFLH